MVETVLIVILAVLVLAFLAGVVIVAFLGSALQLDLDDADYSIDD